VPANKPNKEFGKNPAMKDRDRYNAEPVVAVICQIIDICTTALVSIDIN
jgi:hypothetical protein